MKLSKTIAFLVVGIIVTLSVYSCKDMGNVPPPPRLAATLSSVTLAPGGQTTVAISGGNPPYTILRQADTLIAKATLNGTILTLRAAPANLTRSTSVTIQDTDPSGAHDGPNHEEQEFEITIHVSANVVSFATQIQPIFTASCVNAGCHPGGGAPFPLASTVSYGNLVGVNATNGPCAGDKRVLAGNASASALVKRLEGACGLRMPLGSSTPLPADQIRLIRDWVDQGAQNN